jgi:ABC-2 type transport system ATP-binding protein
MTDAAIMTRDLTKVYRSQIGKAPVRSLDGLNLTVREHEVFGFLGQNGAGKTTTIKMLCSLLRPTRGEAFVFGENVRTRRGRTRIGYLPESPYFYEYLNPRETLDFYGRLQGLDARARAREWTELGEMLDLARYGTQRVRGFSKGMRQRLGFAVALVGNPDVLILDEPMSGLDPLGRRRIRELILALRDRGKTLFFSSHVLGDVEQVCDRVGILVRGELTSEGRIDKLLERKVRQVEVITAGLGDDDAARIAAGARSSRVSDAGRHFLYDSEEEANAAARAVLGAGGALVEFTQVRESLEDYFMREQGAENAGRAGE